MAADVNLSDRGHEDGDFNEDYFLSPHEEDVWARSEHLAADNWDALRHHVELLVWKTREDSDLLRVVVSLLWHMEDVALKWVAEACFMDVGDVRDLAESRPMMTFTCLDCAVELQPRNRRHLLQMQRDLRTLRGGEGDGEHCTGLLCRTCSRLRAHRAEQQRRLDDARKQAMLADYRRRPYAERRKTREWAVLKSQIHRRDGHRCRLCGSGGGPLHVHHRTYANYAEEKLEDVITLCGACHQRHHFLEAS